MRCSSMNCFELLPSSVEYTRHFFKNFVEYNRQSIMSAGCLRLCRPTHGQHPGDRLAFPSSSSHLACISAERIEQAQDCAFSGDGLEGASPDSACPSFPHRADTESKSFGRMRPPRDSASRMFRTPDAPAPWPATREGLSPGPSASARCGFARRCVATKAGPSR